ncbi:MAG: 30S ribosome-binding factor RbfA, partial [Lentisphaeria bacterium]
MSYNRITRVNEVLKREISEWFEKNLATEIDALITFTTIDTSADLQHAKVFISVLGGEALEIETLELLEQFRPSLQHHLAKRVKLKFTPVLEFHCDHTPRDADRVLSIIDEVVPPEMEAQGGNED